MSRRDVRLYLQDIVEAIYTIEEFTKDIDFQTFCDNKMVFQAVVRNFEIIGEATNNVYPYVEEMHYSQEVSYPAIIGMRNHLIHEYFGVIKEVVWETIEEDLPKLKTEVDKLLEIYQTSDE
ncbi:MAG: DUF86 domain-containing protein [Candidatus Paceibacteria bacterium]